MKDYHNNLADIIATRFISRHDAYAIQQPGGGYYRQDGNITRELLLAHLNKQITIGHYVLGGENLDTCKFFCFDVDLATNGTYLVTPDPALMPATGADDWLAANTTGPHTGNVRMLWKRRDPNSRPYIKERLRTLGEILTSTIHDVGIPTAMTYSGSKGIHVYGFTGPAQGEQAIALAELVITKARDRGCDFKPAKGSNSLVDYSGNFPGMGIEIFPKQPTALKADGGHGYGNLVRVEFGKNQNSPDDPCFLVDQRLAHVELSPHPDPVSVLSSGQPWKD